MPLGVISYFLRGQRTVALIVVLAGLFSGCTSRGQLDVATLDIHDAAAHGASDRVRELLQEGKDPNVLEAPALFGHTDVLRILLENGADVNGVDSATPLYLAVIGGHADAVELLLDYGADPDVPFERRPAPYSMKGALGANVAKVRRTPLHKAVTLEDEKIARLLLLNGANPVSRDLNGLTPLHYAARQGNTNMTRLLTQHGARVNVRDFGRVAALQLHGRDYHLDLSPLGSRCQYIQSTGMTPLQYAAAGGHQEVMAFLLSRGAEINAGHGQGWTALHWSAYAGEQETTCTLLENGADPNAKDSRGRTPLHVAVMRLPPHRQAEKRQEIVSILLKYGANISAEDKNGNSPADLAIKTGLTGIAHMLQNRRRTE